eukprot:11159268-Lingulodinium_polyedra.AAC.1
MACFSRNCRHCWPCLCENTCQPSQQDSKINQVSAVSRPKGSKINRVSRTQTNKINRVNTGCRAKTREINQ